MRWRVEISPDDVTKFRQQCLDPILEQLCDWWAWVTVARTGSDYGPFSQNDGCENSKDFPVPSYSHFRFPFGVYNPLMEGNASDLDEYLNSGSELGLQRTTNLFPELS